MYTLGRAPGTPSQSLPDPLCLGSSSYPLSITEHVSPGNLHAEEVKSLSSSLLLSTLHSNPCQAHSKSPRNLPEDELVLNEDFDDNRQFSKHVTLFHTALSFKQLPKIKLNPLPQKPLRRL